MRLHTEWVEYDVGGTRVQGYLARPAAAKDAPLPGVVVIQEAFGVDAFIQDVTERLATAGYAALAPDLFSYGGRPAPLAPERVEDAKRLLDTLPPKAWGDPTERGLAVAAEAEPRRTRLEETLSLLLPPTRPWEQYLATLRAGRAWLSAGPAKGRRVGALGFCLGGALSLRLACSDAEVAASVVYYGAPPPHELLAGLRAPVLGLYAEQDPNITPHVPALADAMRAQGKQLDSHILPGTKHAFFNDTRGTYHVDAAREAWARTLGFLVKTLAGT